MVGTMSFVKWRVRLTTHKLHVIFPEVHVNFKIYIRKYLNKLKLSLIMGKHDSLSPKNTTS